MLWFMELENQLVVFSEVQELRVTSKITKVPETLRRLYDAGEPLRIQVPLGLNPSSFCCAFSQA